VFSAAFSPDGRWVVTAAWDHTRRIANQMRLILHTAAYWLLLTVRDEIPKAHPLAKAEFATIRLRLLKLGARVIETTSRIHLAFAAACPDAALVRHLATTICPAGS
jgi:hypothetical protein